MSSLELDRAVCVVVGVANGPNSRVTAPVQPTGVNYSSIEALTVTLPVL